MQNKDFTVGQGSVDLNRFFSDHVLGVAKTITKDVSIQVRSNRYEWYERPPDMWLDILA